MECSHCHSENKESSKFCKQCGTELIKTCPSCGNRFDEESRFCDACGYKLHDPQEFSDTSRIDFNEPHSYTPQYLKEKILTSRGAIEGERKPVTVLFADVAHSTRLFEHMDPEQVHTIMDGFFNILITAVHQYEGTINQFLGDGIMAIFGAPVAHEDHAQRACCSALAIQTALSDYRPGLKEQYGINFNIRIGINTGQVVVGSIGDDLRMDYTAVGDTTNIAFHLQQIASPGQIAFGHHTFRAVENQFEHRYLGEKKLKQRENPVKYYSLKKEKTRRSRVEREAEDHTLTPLVDRKKELSVMLDLFESVKKGQGQAICILGEAGEGKTRLIYEFRKKIDPQETTYLDSQCIAYGKTIPYYPVLELLKKSFKVNEFDSPEKVRSTIETKLKKIDSRLVDSIPILYRLLSVSVETDAVPADDPEEIKELTFEALRLLILSSSQKKPIVLVMENLQWIDKTSEEFLTYIIDRMANFSVFVVLNYRLDYTHPFGSKSYLRQISLRRLSDDQQNQFIRLLLPDHRLPTDFLQMLFNKAEGNPLYLEEIVKSLLGTDIIIKDEHGYKLTKQIKEIDIPDSIQEIVLARVDRLKDQSKLTLQTASVIGREFTLKMLAKKETLERQLKRHVGELRKLELIHEKSFYPEIEYMFKNAVTKDVIYNSLLLTQRKELHKRIAESIERLYEDQLEDYFEMLAFHYLQSETKGKSINYLIQAGKKAKRIYANNEAIEYFIRALEIIDTADGQWRDHQKDVHQEVASLYDLVGDYEQSHHHYRKSLDFISSMVDKVEILRKMGMVQEKRGELIESMNLYEQAMQVIGDKDFPLEKGRLYMNIGWLHNRNGDYGKALEFCNQALTIFQAEKRDYESAMALNNLAVIQEFRGEWDQAEKLNLKSIRLIHKIGDQRKLGSFCVSAGLLSWKQRKYKKSKSYFNRSYKIMESIGNNLGMANSLLNLGRTYTSEGNFHKALSHLQESLSIFEKIGAKAKLCQCYSCLAEAHCLGSHFEEAKQYCSEGMKIAMEIPYLFDQGKFHLISGQIAAKENRDGEEHFTKGIEIFSSLGRKFELALAFEQLAHANLNKGQKKLGLQHIEAANKIFRELGLEEVITAAS